MSLRSKLILTAAKAVIVPFVSTVAGKCGEAVGDLLAFKINPPTCDECGQPAKDGHECPSSS